MKRGFGSRLETQFAGGTGVITRQSHLSQNCESFIRHNDPCPITSHATYDRDLYYCGESPSYIASRKTKLLRSLSRTRGSLPRAHDFSFLFPSYFSVRFHEKIEMDVVASIVSGDR